MVRAVGQQDERINEASAGGAPSAVIGRSGSAAPGQAADPGHSPGGGVAAAAGTAAAKYGLLGILGVEIVVFSILAPKTFPTSANFENILASQAIFMILTLGLTIPVLAGEFDVSVAYTLGFSTVLIGYLTVLHHWALVPALIACIVACALIGLVNAILVVKVGINSFIATLGTGTILAGLANLLSNSAVIPGLPEPLRNAASEKVFGLPLPVYYGLGLALALWVIYEHFPLGRRMTFVGSGPDAASLAGIRVQRIRAGAFVASAIIAGLAGLVLAGQFNASDPASGPAYLLPAFAGVFLGATAIKPGRANAWGTVIALYVLTVGVTGLQLLGAGAWIQDVFNGGALVIGVAITRLSGDRSGRTSGIV